MKRYEFYLDGYSGGMRVSKNGKFVLYEDVEHLIEKEKNENNKVARKSDGTIENPYDLSNSISRAKRRRL